MKKNIIAFLVLVALIFVAACSDSEHTTSKFDDDTDIADSFKSSSSISDRLDIFYNDTIPLGDTINMYVGFPVWDTTETVVKDEEGNLDTVTVINKCQEGVLCVDSGATEVPLFLAGLPVGTRIQVSIATSDIAEDTLYVVSEKGETLRARKPVWNSLKKDSIFTNYMIPGKGAELSNNEFVAFSTAYYYINLKGLFVENSHIRIVVKADSAYYGYTGDRDTLFMSKNDTVHGIIPIETSPEKISILFDTPLGYNINIMADGEWINRFQLADKKGNILDSSDALTPTIEQLLFPEDSTSEWTLTVEPLRVENYMSGPFATFEAITFSRQLGKGEYIANADSIGLVGDTLTVVRECKEEAKCYLRQEQFVWLGDYNKGDSINIFHDMSGYYTKCSRTPCPANYSIINQAGKVLGTIDDYEHGFKATEKGPVYLRYLRLNSPARVDPPLLTLKTYIQRPGSLNSLAFYDDKKEKTYDTKYVIAKDTVFLKDFKFQTNPYKTSSNMKWFVPCDDLNFLGTTGYIMNIDNCKANGTEWQVSGYLIAQEGAEGETARLIAESLADPLMRDTLKILIQ